MPEEQPVPQPEQKQHEAHGLLAEAVQLVGPVILDWLAEMLKTIIHAKKSDPAAPPVTTAADGPGGTPPDPGPTPPPKP